MNEYDIFAPLYDKILYFPLKDIRKKVTKIVSNYKPKNLVDFCCGTGDQLHSISDSLDFKVKMAGIDLSKPMLKIAKKRKSQPKFLLMDATKTNFRNECFDMAITSFALHEKNREDANKIIQEVERVLRPNGIFIIADYFFNKQTSLATKAAIHTIERIAGREHYSFFKTFLKEDQLNPLMGQFKLLETYQKSNLGAAVFTYQKKS